MLEVRRTVRSGKNEIITIEHVNNNALKNSKTGIEFFKNFADGMSEYTSDAYCTGTHFHNELIGPGDVNTTDSWYYSDKATKHVYNQFNKLLGIPKSTCGYRERYALEHATQAEISTCDYGNQRTVKLTYGIDDEYQDANGCVYSYDDGRWIE